MSKIIRVLDYTHRYIDESILEKMKDVIGKGDTLDFNNVFIMDSDIPSVGDIIIENELVIEGLDEESLLLLESYIRKKMAPEFSNLKEFTMMFKEKFSKGTLCIWDRILDNNLKASESRMSLVMIEEIYDNFVRFRLYKSYLIEPKYVYEHGGLDNKDLYTLETVHLSDFANKTVIFRYPKDDNEEIILNLLMSI